ncbi:MAG TPA: TonB-dependent receptor, partial [Candidatus Kapabacteria bacterium]|nr:TonB-dependent receptor [Candidatus Kapabacteria bacterium]
VKRLALVLSILLLPIVSSAQRDSVERRDSVRVYRMGEITVGGERERDIKTVTVQQIPLARLQRADVSTAEQLALQIPAGQIRTNSRGEALVFLRGLGERQVAVFLDGALMNIPWDNRIDLAMLPLNAVGAVTVTKGVPSILYGANVTGGAVSFISQEQPTDGITSDIGFQAGQYGYMNGYYTNLGASGPFNYVASLGYMKRDAYGLPNEAETPFSQIGREERTNTDQKLMNGYVRGEYKFGDLTTAGLSFNYITGEKGIPAEAHVPGEDARFWRYPEYSNFHTILNVESHLTEAKDWTLRGSAWFNQFAQSIDQYTDSTYTTIDVTEEDDDATIGTRLVLRRDFGGSTIDLSLNALTSSHDQKDFGYDSVGNPEDAPLAEYKQNIYSAGLEYQTKLTNDLKLIAGGTYDIMNTPKTGGRPAQEDLSDFSAMIGLGYSINDNLSLRANGGRKTRFPTMRELYGEALNRFVLNPDLHAERTNILELGLTGSYDWGRFEIVGFDYITDGTIERIDTTLE